ncbi:MAG: DUF547 domain-containing protein [Saprospiraceae bacterium]|nr:DUF547 domain-containing protein [Saprospiraceae bacterium]
MKFPLLLLFLFLRLAIFAQTPLMIPPAPPVKPPSHERWDALLKKHVREDGRVDYRGFQRDSQELNRYLKTLEYTPPDSEAWTTHEQMAYWINAYNAFTIQLVIRHYPVESIKDIKRGVTFVNTVWDIKFIRIGGKSYDLNNIEHGILRKDFKDARIHAALNCASVSCPPLRREAFTATNLHQQLDAAMRSFVNDPARNRIAAGKAEISEIFKWFDGDFVRDAGSVKAYINRYAKSPVGDKTSLNYLPYDWNLNE